MSAATIIAFPSVQNASDIQWSLERLDGRFTSPLSGTFQDIVRPGARWICQMSWKTVKYSDARLLEAWAAQMATGGFRTALPNQAYKAQGSYSGTGVVNGAGQTGLSLATRGWTANAANIAMAGDLIGISTATQHQLLMVTANANADALGDATLAITPALRISPADGAALSVVSPAAYFAFAKPSYAVHYTPPRIGSFSVALIEDILL